MNPVLIDALRLLSDHTNQTSRYFAIFAVQEAKTACETSDVAMLLKTKSVIEVTQEITGVLDGFKSTVDAIVAAAEEMSAEFSTDASDARG